MSSTTALRRAERALEIPLPRLLAGTYAPYGADCADRFARNLGQG